MSDSKHLQMRWGKTVAVTQIFLVSSVNVWSSFCGTTERQAEAVHTGAVVVTALKLTASCLALLYMAVGRGQF